MKLRALLIMGISLLISACTQKVNVAPKNDEDQLQGRWNVVEVQEKGRRLDADETKNSWLTVKSNQMDWVRGEETVRATFMLDPTQEPKMIDLEEPKLGKSLGIYSLEGDKLTISMTVNFGQAKEAERPKAFKTSRGKKVTLIVFKRDKP